jgi:hypothetical protein
VDQERFDKFFAILTDGVPAEALPFARHFAVRMFNCGHQIGMQDAGSEAVSLVQSRTGDPAKERIILEFVSERLAPRLREINRRNLSG